MNDSVDPIAHIDLDAAAQAAIEAANAASRLITDYLESGNWQESRKDDQSPVTEVDIASEKRIRDVLTAACPGFAFYGEETGASGPAGDAASQPCWLVDPIDGTKSFVRHMPFWSIQIALEYQGDLLLGVSTAPLWGEQVVAIQGKGVKFNGESLAPLGEAVTSLDEVFLSTGNLTSLAQDDSAWQRFGQLVGAVRRTRGYGDFCHYHQLLRAQTDLIVESDVNILDIAALTVAVREVGGIITDLQGKAIDRHTRSVLAAGNPILHQEVLQQLATGSLST